jgi:hypothetical protein
LRHSLKNKALSLSVDLVGKATGFRRTLPSRIVAALADLVQAMHHYCLIEGRERQPVGVERALKNDDSADPCGRDPKFETNAPLAVQKWIAGGPLCVKATTAEIIGEIRRRFCHRAPDPLLSVEAPDIHRRVVLGREGRGASLHRTITALPFGTSSRGMSRLR